MQAAGGGVTLSGGDPLFQPDFAGAVLKGCRKLGLHTCLDTSGHLSVNAGEEMLADTDLVLLDIKAWNPKRYRALTGGELRPTLEFAERLASLRKPMWLRYVLVPGVTDNLEEIEELSRHAALLGNVERVDVLPFHQLGRFKWDELKLDYTLKDVPEASAELAEQVRGISGGAAFRIACINRIFALWRHQPQQTGRRHPPLPDESPSSLHYRIHAKGRRISGIAPEYGISAIPFVIPSFFTATAAFPPFFRQRRGTAFRPFPDYSFPEISRKASSTSRTAMWRLQGTSRSHSFRKQGEQHWWL